MLFSIVSLVTGGFVISAEKVDFARDIRPILSDKCIYCHGPDEAHREANLRLDLKEDAFADKDGVTAFRKGDLANSEAWYRIITDDEDELMPPPKSNKSLTAEEKDLIKRWIESGAEWTEHWSFVPPSQSEEKQSIDQFVKDAAAKKGLEPSPKADKTTLIRRATFDLTGLPPTQKEVQDFLADESPDAYEKVVDRLLKSEHFGERMAVYWLDAARYGDTSVMHADGPRDMWPWRDWVVNAYNTNQPFDQFSIEQIAGDLLPDATPEQRIASGFNRNHPSSDEGGAIPEELRVSYVVDRVKTTSNVWLGLSMECSQCHDHKYDPISQKEYFEFYAYFNNTSDPGMQTRKGNQTPVIEVPDPARDLRLKEMEAKLEAAKAKVAAHREKARGGLEKWFAAASAKEKGKPGKKQPEGLKHWFPISADEKDIVRDSVTGKTGTLEKGGKFLHSDRSGGKALNLNGSTAFLFDGWPQYEADQPFTFTGWIKGNNANGAVISRMNSGNGYRGYDIWMQGNRVSTHIIHAWSGDALKVVAKEPLKKNQWQHVALTYDGSRKQEGVKIFVDGKLVEHTVEANTLTKTVKPADKIPFRIGSRTKGANVKCEVDDLRIYDRVLAEDEIAVTKTDPVEGLLKQEWTSLSDSQQNLVFNYYLAKEDKTYQKLSTEESKQAKSVADLQQKPTTSMVMGDNPPDKMRKTFILDRGQYDAPKEEEEIMAGVPAVLPSLPEDAAPNRLSLANWLFADEHPLTARVTINQLWQIFFGKGIVSTPADFGSQGAFPTHPELLDWLAVEFRESGWDVKKMVRQMVMSETYQQSSKVRVNDLEDDPENKFLARAPRFRLQAEFIRDNALALSGTLNRKMGGPGVKPYQPPGLWAEVSLGGNPKFVQDKGDKLYRRSLYTYWKRSAPPPSMQIFDAPTREICVLKRPRTNTPLQALAAMNDVQVMEAARHFAERMIREGGDSPESRASYAFELATARPPSGNEMAAMLNVYQYGKEVFAAEDAKAAKELLQWAGESSRDESIAPDEHAALTMVASLILNLDETLTRE